MIVYIYIVYVYICILYTIIILESRQKVENKRV